MDAVNRSCCQIPFFRKLFVQFHDMYSLDPVNLHISNLAVSHIAVPGTHIQFPGGNLYVALIQIDPFVEPFIEREPEVLAVYAILKL